LKKVRKTHKRKLKPKAKAMILAIIALIALTILVKTFQSNGFALIGKSHTEVNISEEYIEEGVTYRGKDVTDEVDIDISKVDYTKQGKYQIIYTYQTKKGKKLKLSRTIEVKDLELPVLTLNGGSEIHTLLNEKFNDPLYQAIDNVDGDLTNEVKVTGEVNTTKEGEYLLTYEVKDKSGNIAKKVRKVIVSSKSPLNMSLEEFSLEEYFKGTILEEVSTPFADMDEIIYAGDSMVLYYDINKLVPSKRLWYRNSIDPKTALTATMFHLYQDTEKTMVEMYKENQPKISIITLGTNSVAYMDIEVFVENYRTLLKEIINASPKTRLIVQSIPPVDKKKDKENSPINNDKINKFNYHIAKLAQELGLEFLNSATAMKDEKGYAKDGYCIDYDGIHPSKVGHTALYEYTKYHLK